MDTLSPDMIAFMEGIIHQEQFEKNGYSYDMKTFTSYDRANAFIEKNDTFSIMHESNGYIYVGVKTPLEEKQIDFEKSYDCKSIYEAAISRGMTEEQARDFIISMEG